jgi:hypothetical protein
MFGLFKLSAAAFSFARNPNLLTAFPATTTLNQYGRAVIFLKEFSMSTHFRVISAMFVLFTITSLGCSSKEAEGVPPGVNLPPPQEREKQAKAGFTLEVKDKVVKLVQGGNARVLVTAQRTGYEGPIVIELSNLPGKVSPVSKAIIAAGAKEVEIEITAAKDADLIEKTDVVAMTSNPVVASPRFTIKVEKAAQVVVTPTKQLELRVDPELVKVTQGDKIKVRVSAERNGFEGPIVVELANMPANVTGTKGLIAADKNDVVLELTTDAKAAVGETKDVAALGNSKILSKPFTIEVVEAAALFELRVKEEMVEVKQGDKAKLEITIVRKSYDGPINLELTNLPAKVTMGKVTLEEGKSRKALEIVADAAAPEGKKDGVTLVATADGKTILSKPFAIVVTKGTGTTSEVAPFDLALDQSEVTLKAGTKIKLRVRVTRQNSYQGKIVVELKGLPPVVKSSKLFLKEGQLIGDIELWALPTAPTGQITDVTPVGTASDAKDRQIASQAKLTVNVLAPVVVVPLGPSPDAVWFVLNLQPATLNIRPGTFAIVRATVTRKNGFAGSVSVQLKNLPNGVQAGAATIAKNQPYVNIQVFANPRAMIGSTGNVTAVGTGTFAKMQQQQTSPAVTVTVVKK